ncbi:hypothetical protein ACUN0C_16730 [Faunimonas sp. B44]|uniref:hypothetical protein n=1 Tax=Faunimonas sp. B44 TaxID=3461493 RepID=UPI0040446B2B
MEIPTCAASPLWLRSLRRYLALLAIGNLGWEAAQLPLYTLWRDGTTAEIAFAVAHCTAGDVLIGLTALLGGLLAAGGDRWPGERFGAVALTTIGIGLGYTVYSEWLNTEVGGAWAYSNLMPILPGIGTGLSPLAQWLVIPGIALWWVRPTRELGNAR